jgi:hypothetical protein
MADSVMLATAYRYRATLWTQDSDFEDLQECGSETRFTGTNSACGSPLRFLPAAEVSC